MYRNLINIYLFNSMRAAVQASQSPEGEEEVTDDITLEGKAAFIAGLVTSDRTVTNNDDDGTGYTNSEELKCLAISQILL